MLVQQHPQLHPYVGRPHCSVGCYSVSASFAPRPHPERYCRLLYSIYEYDNVGDDSLRPTDIDTY
jgi:hypothetical protein